MIQVEVQAAIVAAEVADVVRIAPFTLQLPTMPARSLKQTALSIKRRRIFVTILSPDWVWEKAKRQSFQTLRLRRKLFSKKSKRGSAYE
jgi:hypothetical protein